ncbi:MAG: DUF6790 family protein [Candidatus Dormibacteraceae bacterium]
MSVSTEFPAWGPWLWPAAAIVGTALHLLLSRRPRTGLRILEVFLLWWFGWGVGVTALIAFYANGFLSDPMATRIGFPTGNPFQWEVASANLAVCVAGFLCLRYRDRFWEATTVVATVYLWGAAVGHIRQYVQFGNNHPYNTGPILWTDIFVQVVLIAALIIYRRMQHASAVRATATAATENVAVPVSDA